MSLDVESTFFVVPGQFLNAVEADLTSSLRYASNMGHEIALHGFLHLKNEFGCFYPVPMPFLPFPSFSRQKECLSKAVILLQNLCGVKPIGFRAPFYLYNFKTIDVLAALGFLYDSSATLFKPVHASCLRTKWTREDKPFLTHGILEIPVAGDYTYNLAESNFISCLKRALRDFEMVASRKGVFVITTHPNRSSVSLLTKFLSAFVKQLKPNVDFVKLATVRANHKEAG